MVSGDSPLIGKVLHCLFYLGAVFVGAVYVSIINDLTDMDDDFAAGKRNRMSNIPPAWRWTLLSTCLLAGCLFGYLMWPDTQSLFFYAMAWIAFSLYSIRPFRFKNRGVFGVLCDASGAHLFPSLLMVSGMSHSAGQPADGLWIYSVGVWAFCYGLRGILWHQFADRENDLSAGLNTFATAWSTRRFVPYARAIFATEAAALLVMLCYLSIPVLWVSLLAYAGLAYIRRRFYGQRIILVIARHDGARQILMEDFYQVFFPMALLLSASLTEPMMWIALVVHLLLFPQRAFLAAVDCLRAVKNIRKPS